MIKCWSYTGNGDEDGPEIDLGWEPQFVLVKRRDNTGNWLIQDSMRSLSTANTDILFPNLPNESTVGGYPTIVPTATGFYIGDGGTNYNAAGGKYIYMAIRRPNKLAEEFEPEELLAVDTMNVDGQFESGFPVDFAIQRNSLSGIDDNNVMARLIGERKLTTNSSAGEVSEPKAQFDYPDRWYEGAGQNADSVSWMWRRAPGFFDAVTWTGDGVAGREIPHNLGVVPGMIIIKRRDADRGSWNVYHRSTPNGVNGSPLNLRLNSDNGVNPNGSSDFWTTAPTSTEFTIGSNDPSINTSGGTYIAYLFTNVDGICDIGTYDGTGQAGQEVLIPSFTGWVRYLLIKRTDGNGNWWQTVTPGDYTTMIQLNSTAAQEKVSAVAPLGDGRGGFQLTTNDAEFNASGGKYIYYAIA
jgi:hypothetical protein